MVILLHINKTTFEKSENLEKKSHTCGESGAQLRISFWQLLMNLKNNYL